MVARAPPGQADVSPECLHVQPALKRAVVLGGSREVAHRLPLPRRHTSKVRRGQPPKGSPAEDHVHIIELHLRARRRAPEAAVCPGDVITVGKRAMGDADGIGDRVRPGAKHSRKADSKAKLVLADALLA